MEIQVIVPPSENVLGRIVHIQTTQKNIGFFMRQVVKNTLSKLNDTLTDAAIEIYIAKTIYHGPGSYRMFGYGKVTGMRPDEINAWKMDVKKRYEEWNRRLVTSPDTLSLCKSFAQEEESLDSLRKRFHISERRALWRLIYGLNEYCILSGWGNQIEGQR